MSDETTRQDGLHPRDLLFHLREWLNRHWKTNAKHFGDSDQSGHPHGYTGVVIPDWDLRQRLDEIDQSLAIPSPDEAQPAPVRTLVPEDPSKERRQTSPFPPAPAPRDACQLCNGFRGGIPGNENIEEGITMCDYCHATIIQFRRERLKLNANSTVLKKEHQAPQAASPAPEGEPPECVDPNAPVVPCAYKYCGGPVHTCERKQAVNNDYRCPAHPEGNQSGDKWYCSEHCYYEAHIDRLTDRVRRLASKIGIERGHSESLQKEVERLTTENAALAQVIQNLRADVCRVHRYLDNAGPGATGPLISAMNVIGLMLTAIDAILSPQTAQPDPDEHAGGNDGFTGWICGNNYRRRGRLDTCVGKTDREPWYIADDGMRWSSYDVTFRPDPPKAQKGKP